MPIYTVAALYAGNAGRKRHSMKHSLVMGLSVHSNRAFGGGATQKTGAFKHAVLESPNTFFLGVLESPCI